MKFDFSGWATKNDIRCSDGRTIRRGAFQDQDGQKVPLVWQHRHDDPFNVLGHAVLENRDEGVYAYCTFNDTEQGQHAKALVQHGDVSALSIFANRLKQRGGDVLHGAIREVSLVLSGANPGATIVDVMAHSELLEDEAFIFNDDFTLDLQHGEIDMEYDDEYDDEGYEDEYDDGPDEDDEEYYDDDEDYDDYDDEDVEHGEEMGLGDIFNTFTDEQKEAVYEIVDIVTSEDDDYDDYDDDDDYLEQGDKYMKYNVFEGAPVDDGAYLSHDEMENIFNDAKSMGSLKQSFLAHADEYGIMNKDPETGKYVSTIDWLFPEARNLNTPPDWIKRDMGWVKKVLSGTHHTPFSRIKSMFANITEDEARARGYIKGKKKIEEVFSLLKRTTSPQTIYKKQKLDRDDINDITDFSVVAWIKGEMRMMLDEEIARAVLIGDGRLPSDDSHISHEHVRPIWTDDELYSVKVKVELDNKDDENSRAKKFIRAAIKARKHYKGSGSPKLFTTEDFLTDMLLIEDGVGRLIYQSEEQLARTLRVSEIITVPVMEEQTRTVEGETLELAGIIVNLVDYNIGADKGGAVAMFEDFDIDYNQEKYLIETRISGALIKPYSALVIEIKKSGGSTGGGTTNP